MYVAATRTGRRLEEKLMPEVAKIYADLKASLDDATWAQLEFGLQRLAGVSTAAPVAKPATRKRKTS